MATIHRFEDLNAWKKARVLYNLVLDTTGKKPFATDYDLVRQIRRASGSVMDNVAEGFGRGGRGEFVQFLGIAKGSVTEVKSQLYRALDCGYLSDELFQSLYEQADETAKIIDGLIAYLLKTDLKGRRYQREADLTEDSKLKTVN
ncbi:four helix bundle protein [Spirosoma sp.]|uniref:four helix bundle protein n=1 Tax=Spirosoma sp. TaxID=1899569 RepID=UPI003B3B26BE